MHTPLPWNAVKPINAKHSWDWAIEGQNGDIAMKLEYLPPVYHPDGLDGWRQESEDNAALIVRAVNAHEAMRTALKTILEGNTMAGKAEWSHADVIQEHYKIARTALALADGKE